MAPSLKQQERNSLQILVPRRAALSLRNCCAYHQDTEKVRLTVLSFLLLLPGSLTLNLGPKQPPRGAPKLLLHGLLPPSAVDLISPISPGLMHHF